MLNKNNNGIFHTLKKNMTIKKLFCHAVLHNSPTKSNTRQLPCKKKIGYGEH